MRHLARLAQSKTYSLPSALIIVCPIHKAGKGYFIMRAKGMGSHWRLNGKISVLGCILLFLLDSLVFLHKLFKSQVRDGAA